MANQAPDSRTAETSDTLEGALARFGIGASIVLSDKRLDVTLSCADDLDSASIGSWIAARLQATPGAKVTIVNIASYKIGDEGPRWRISRKLDSIGQLPVRPSARVLGTVAGCLFALAGVSTALALLTTRKSAPPATIVEARVETPKTKPNPKLWVDPSSVGRPYGDRVRGLLTFRGNPTRSFYGTGPMPTKTPRVLWRYPDRPMCANSRDRGVTYLWCGTGWTGQPAVFERGRKTWVVFGAYDKAVHFVDAASGRDMRPPFMTGDIIKGSVTVDPDGYPIVYSGSRDGYFRAIDFASPKPRELWRLSAHSVRPTLWNDDWDGSALVLDDHLFVGGENSRMHIARLNRGYDRQGRVRIAPKLVFNTPGWDRDLLRQVGDRNVSIENSVTIFGDKLFFSNSGGLAQGWNIAGLRKGLEPFRAFRFWTGDDTDASIVVDGAGDLYVASEWERRNSRSRRVGQVAKLDPNLGIKKDPLLWSFADQKGLKSGVWATPALYRDILIVATHGGDVLGLDKETSAVRWKMSLGTKVWQSPVVVDGVLLQGDCKGKLSAYDVRNTHRTPKLLWSVRLGGCIESTPAVWNGRIYVGTRDGYFYALGMDGQSG